MKWSWSWEHFGEGEQHQQQGCRTVPLKTMAVDCVCRDGNHLREEAASPVPDVSADAPASPTPTDSSLTETKQETSCSPTTDDCSTDEYPVPILTRLPENSPICSENAVLISENWQIPSEQSIVKHQQPNSITFRRVGGWSFLAALLAINRFFKSQPLSQEGDSLAPLTHDTMVPSDASYGAQAPTLCNRDDQWTDAFTTAFPTDDHKFCSDSTQGTSSPHVVQIQKLSETVSRLQDEMTLKEKEVSVAQIKVEKLTKDKEQQAAEMLQWSQVAKNLEKECLELRRTEIKNRHKIEQKSLDGHNLENLAALSQLLQRKQEELTLKEDNISKEHAGYMMRIEQLMQENEKLVRMYNCNHSYQSTCEYYEQELKKKVEKLSRRHDQIEKLSQGNAILVKQVQDWSEKARYYEAQYLNLLHRSKKHSQHVIHQANSPEKMGLDDRQSQAYREGLIPGVAATLQQQLEAPHCHHLQHQRQQQLHASAAQMQYQEALKRQCEEELRALREQVKYHEERCKELQSRLQVAERQVTQHQLVDTALYQEDQATPTLLHDTAGRVKNAMLMCASNIVRFADQNSLLLNPTFNESLTLHRRKQLVKLSLQAFLCELLFQGFESPTFSFAVPNVPFEKPQVSRRQRLQMFQKMRNLEAADMFEHITEFQTFVQEKVSLVLYKLQAEVLHYNGTDLEPGERQQVIAKLVQDGLREPPNSPFRKSFLRLAKAAWLVHKVAFACEPASAEIFRVSANSGFVKEYMEEHEATKSETLMDEEEDTSCKRVAFMIVPGFTLRNSIIKCIVCCF